MPFFTIIIPLYNKENFVLQTLQSVLNQSFADYEIIVVNDGSTDNGVAVVEQINDDRIKIIHQENKGVSTARNKGIEAAKAEYICFLDADDSWKEDFLNETHRLINTYSNEKVFCAAIEILTKSSVINAQYTVGNKVEENVYIENYFTASMKYSLICTSCSAFHKSVFLEVGNFDEEIRSGQDTDLWIRVGNKFNIVFLNKIMCTYVYDKKSLSRNKLYKTIKLKYDNYKTIESKNKEAKKFLDYNRYSEILNNKLFGNRANVKLLRSQISINNLTFKQKILINLPRFVLKPLYSLQPFLIKIGLRKTIFK